MKQLAMLIVAAVAVVGVFAEQAAAASPISRVGTP
jgi:hypothetical protein